MQPSYSAQQGPTLISFLTFSLIKSQPTLGPYQAQKNFKRPALLSTASASLPLSLPLSLSLSLSLSPSLPPPPSLSLSPSLSLPPSLSPSLCVFLHPMADGLAAAASPSRLCRPRQRRQPEPLRALPQQLLNSLSFPS